LLGEKRKENVFGITYKEKRKSLTKKGETVLRKEKEKTGNCFRDDYKVKRKSLTKKRESVLPQEKEKRKEISS